MGIAIAIAGLFLVVANDGCGDAMRDVSRAGPSDLSPRQGLFAALQAYQKIPATFKNGQKGFLTGGADAAKTAAANSKEMAQLLETTLEIQRRLSDAVREIESRERPYAFDSAKILFLHLMERIVHSDSFSAGYYLLQNSNIQGADSLSPQSIHENIVILLKRIKATFELKPGEDGVAEAIKMIDAYLDAETSILDLPNSLQMMKIYYTRDAGGGPFFSQWTAERSTGRRILREIQDDWTDGKSSSAAPVRSPAPAAIESRPPESRSTVAPVESVNKKPESPKVPRESLLAGLNFPENFGSERRAPEAPKGNQVERKLPEHLQRRIDRDNASTQARQARAQAAGVKTDLSLQARKNRMNKK